MNPPRRLTHRLFPALLAAGLAFALSCAHTPPPPPLTWNQIEALPVSVADHTIRYGSDSLQFGELRLPQGAGPFPVAVVIHGGCWRAEYDVKHIGPLAGALTAHGVATWTIEYRRIGNDGGGWPGTFEDVARGTDYLRELAKQYPLDLARVVTVGHSAGGHLALWLAARKGLPASAPRGADPLPLRGVVGLAAVSDLREFARGTSFCMQQPLALMGGTADSLPELWAQADPSQLLPLGVPVRLVHGEGDKVVPIAQSRSFEKLAAGRGDRVRLAAIEGAGHFDVIAPSGAAFEQLEHAVRDLLGK